ncbi:MAG: AsmA family protein [Elusimicrobia bacterium]|nr:AsmA family protein [Elusimicrobiota bacterium]
MERITGPIRGLIKFAVFVFLILAIAGTVVEFGVPKDQLRALAVQNLQQRLRRQVKIGAISIGPWRGLRVEKLEISESPDFTAGTFVSAERLTVKPSFLPLFMGKIAVGEVTLTEPKVRVVRQAGGKYNFSGLLDAPPAPSPGGLAPLGQAPAAPAASTAAPAGLPPLKPLGGGKLDPVALLTTGWDDPPKKLAELGALAIGAAAEASTKVQFDIERLRIRRGTVEYVDPENAMELAAGGLSVWAEGLTPRSQRTDVSVDGRITGKLRDQPTELEFSLEARMELDKSFYPVVTIGHLILNKIRHPSFVTERIRAEWDLKGMSPELTSASGVIRLEGSPGDINRPAYLKSQGKWPGLLLYPVEVLAKFRGLGLPDLLKIPYNELRGEYSFAAGSVNMAPLYVRGPLVSINAEGVINLLQRTVGLKANVIMGKSAIGVLIKGPMDSPAVTADVSFKGGPKRKHRTAEQDLNAGQLLEQSFGGNPDALTPDEPAAQAAVKAGLKKGLPKDFDRTHTIKDAEKLIDQPLPED